MAKVELKQPIVQEISENIKDAQSVVVVDYRGLTVAEDTQLRKALSSRTRRLKSHHLSKDFSFSCTNSLTI